MELKISPELPKLIEALTGLAWPIFASILLWKIFPSVRNVIDSRQFTLKIGGMEVSAQQASESLATQVDDLQKKVTELRAALDNGGVSVAAQSRNENAEGSIGVELSSQARITRRVLWVDDQPENNVFEIAKLKKEGIEVVEARSTTEAMRLIISGREPFGLVITDIGRREDGEYRAKGGLLLIQNIRRAGLQNLPVVVYASTRYLDPNRDEVREAGANGATASPLELFELIHSFI
jgi:CheY-like chemotaxis protein